MHHTDLKDFIGIVTLEPVQEYTQGNNPDGTETHPVICLPVDTRRVMRYLFAPLPFTVSGKINPNVSRASEPLTRVEPTAKRKP